MANEDSLSISGKIIAVLEQKTGTKKDGGTWVAQEFVLQTSDQYPKSICFEVWGEEKIAQADLKAGDDVNIGINIDASEYKGRWYNKVKAWRVNKKGVAPAYNASEAPNKTNQGTNGQSNCKDDLPF